MGSNTIETKLALYHEFFAIDHEFSVNIQLLDNTEEVSFEEFMARMPMPFKLATEVSSIDQSALQSFKSISSNSSALVNLFNQQSQKIDLLIGYILSQQDEVQSRFKGINFGGGGIKFVSPEPLDIGQLLELKIFILNNNCALYCYGEVIAIENTDPTAKTEHVHKVIFHYIREEDRETLVRASLHEQSKQLQKLAKLRNQEKSAG